MTSNKKTFIVDGIMLTGEEGRLVMEFKVGGMIHKFKISKQNAIKMAEAFQGLFLTNN